MELQFQLSGGDGQSEEMLKPWMGHRVNSVEAGGGSVRTGAH